MDVAVLVSIIVVAALVVLLALYLWASYQSLVALKQRVDEAWGDIAQQLQRRAELIPELLESVRGYATHERQVFDAVTTARAESLAATTPGEASVAENHLQQSLRSVFAVAEAYPQLQAGQRFLGLQGQLVDSEQRIQESRRFYNGGVREQNTKIRVFPNGMFARRLGFTEREFFEVPDGRAIAEPPRIQF